MKAEIKAENNDRSDPTTTAIVKDRIGSADLKIQAA